MARNLDMNRMLAASDQRHFTHYNNMTDEAKKEFVYSVVLRWANTITDTKDRDAYLVAFNKRVNLHGEMMWRHPDLVFAMMASCGPGRVLKHQYSKPPKREPEHNALFEFISSEWPGINRDEFSIIISQLDKPSFDDLLSGSNLDPNEQKKIAGEYAKEKRQNP